MILVMEENATVRGVIQHALGRHGFSVEFATDCDQAHRLFEKHQTEFAVILLDIESGGLEFVNGIPTREPRIPVLFTATNSEHNLPAVAQQGFPCLPKPFKPETLINRLEQLLPARHVQRLGRAR
jgi:CheY-like chemotaxis protein